MATLTITNTTNFSNSALTDITQLRFFNAFGTATATFSAAQFGTQISNSLAVTGSPAGDCKIVVVGSSMDASGWTFATWSSDDEVNLTGTSGADTLTGSSQRDLIDGGSGADIIRGGLGVDTLRGSSGDDTIVFAAGEAIAADSIDGGVDADKLVVVGTASFDFHACTINNVERLVFSESGASTVTLDNGHIGGAGDILSVDGGNFHDELRVIGGEINLSAVTFTDWTAGDDSVVIQISGGTAIGSVQNDDILDVGQGAVVMLGGEGEDIFHYSGGSGSAVGDAIDGGAGITDTILIETSGAAASVNLSGLASLTGVEVVAYSESLNCSATITDALIATGITTISGGAGIDQLTVQVTALNGNFNANKLSFQSWSDSQDKLTIQGNASNNKLTGTGTSDVIAGSAGGDKIHGGSGSDTLDGGTGGNDLLDYAGSSAVIVVLASNAASGGDAQGDVIANFENVSGGNGGDILIGNVINNQINGAGGSDTIQGGDGQDSLRGGAGADHITGGSDKDLLAGGGASDTFIYIAVSDSFAAGSRDVISDFELGIDKIDLSGIDAIGGGLDDPFRFRGEAGFGPQAGLRYIQKETETIVFGDVNGDRDADFALVLEGSFTLAATDFVL
jgi:Ca2+-binding RTX toxin-like protein